MFGMYLTSGIVARGSNEFFATRSIDIENVHSVGTPG